jgi:hypothetical protein
VETSYEHDNEHKMLGNYSVAAQLAAALELSSIDLVRIQRKPFVFSSAI